MQTPCACEFDPDAPFWSAARFVTRDRCGAWDPFMARVYEAAHNGISAAYIAISIILVWAYLRHRGEESVMAVMTPGELALARVTFAAFILMCGLGHLEGSIAFWWPAYHLFTIWHGLTAAVSWYAVFVVFRLRVKIVAGF